MSIQGQILVARKPTTLSRIKLQNNKIQFTSGSTESLLPGKPVLCVLDNIEVAVLYGQMTWRAKRGDFIPISSTLSGKSFCFTGNGPHVRPFYKSLVTLSSGTYESSVTRGTSYLVSANADSTDSKNSTKALKAKYYGIPTISYKDFHDMVGRELW
jgi:NAD-dependent DNA ligase